LAPLTAVDDVGIIPIAAADTAPVRTLRRDTPAIGLSRFILPSDAVGPTRD